MTTKRGLVSAAYVARSAIRALECRHLAASEARLNNRGTSSIWAVTGIILQPGQQVSEARYLSHTQASTSTRNFFTMGTPMPAKVFNQRRLVGWAPEQLYAVVSRVEDYHKFVPWCQKSTVVKPMANNYLEAELEVGFQVLVERYTSQVFLMPPRSVRSRVADSSLFDHLDSTWTMEAGPTPRSCWLSFSVDFAFRSQLHGYLADIFFTEVVKQMSGAFEGRCAKLYGPSSLVAAPKSAGHAAAGTASPRSQVSMAAAVGAPHSGRAHGHGHGACRVHKPGPAAGGHLAAQPAAVKDVPKATIDGVGSTGLPGSRVAAEDPNTLKPESGQ
ncbi:hypothetical protein Vafri_20432 [Volvox africanus]|uniref:Coenzyme Q-binding protein COQ10 START domain-containing protein n=1 Tax=Volvox africanus TaxID=51714 RepID=A0A8J4BRB3_9CHLO|nr:hypothetical protein Vafri_20432 [Volvox africanus]